MRRSFRERGFLLCFCVSLLWHSGWAVAALALWLLHLWLRIPLFLSLIVLGVWPLSALFYTAVISWSVRSSAIPTPPRENRNPYSAKTSDFLPKKPAPDPEK